MESNYDLILNKIRISDVIGGVVDLIKHGNNYKGICPFHNDKNPSLVVNDDKKIYKCFSCNTSGNCITFIQNYYNINSTEAIARLNQKYDLNLKNLVQVKQNQYSDQQLDIFEVNQLANLFFQNNLNSKLGQDVRKYLKSRNINDDSIELFNIGYANKNFKLNKYLTSQKYNLMVLEKANLIRVSSSIDDFFFNHLIIPIFNENNKIVGFGGRSLNKNNDIKYLNTSQNVVFTKSDLIFNLSQAKKEIQLLKNVIIVEGYMDVISLTQHGFKNCVALMGTNLSKNQIYLLKKETKKITLFLDGDSAGINATYDIGIKLLYNNFKVFIVKNNSNNDPDNIVNQNDGKKTVKELITNSCDAIDFFIDYYSKKYDLKKADDLEQFIEKIIKLLKPVQNLTAFKLYKNKLIELVPITDEEINQKMYKQFNYQSITRYSEPEPQQPSWPKLSYIKAEKRLLIQIIKSRDASDFYKKHITCLNNIKLNEIATLFQMYYERNPNKKNIGFSELKEIFLNRDQLLLIIEDAKKQFYLDKVYCLKIVQSCQSFIEKQKKVKQTNELIKKRNLCLDNQQKIEYSNQIKNMKQSNKI